MDFGISAYHLISVENFKDGVYNFPSLAPQKFSIPKSRRTNYQHTSLISICLDIFTLLLLFLFYCLTIKITVTLISKEFF